jgi:hypothetical protein
VFPQNAAMLRRTQRGVIWFCRPYPPKLPDAVEVRAVDEAEHPEPVDGGH